jgi:carbamoyl-phosphate synthase large subunit
MAVFPAHDISDEIRDKVIDYTVRLALELGVIGLINIQFVEFNDELLVLEVNPRSSRTIPFISKVTESRWSNWLSMPCSESACGNRV